MIRQAVPQDLPALLALLAEAKLPADGVAEHFDSFFVVDDGGRIVPYARRMADEVWGKWLIEELAEHGHRLSPGTLYPALTRMESNGWLRRSGKARHPRARQTFRITPEGRRLLAGRRRDVAELYQEVVLEVEPQRAPTPARSRRRGAGRSSRARTRQASERKAP